MNTYRLLITPTALKDIDDALCYYNAEREGLGYEFGEAVDAAFQRIAMMPTAYGRRYKDVRGKLLKRFPYLILFQIDETDRIVQIVRIFNTYQQPFWK